MLLKLWSDQSIQRKLYFVVGLMALLIVSELITLTFAMHTLSAVRAFVGAEGLWSKAQKNADISLSRYVVTRDEADFKSFLSFLAVPEGDHQARIELQRQKPDFQIATSGFLAGQVNAEDIPRVIILLRRFYWTPPMAKAIQIWTEGDNLLAEFRDTGVTYHALLMSPHPNLVLARQVSEKFYSLNQQLTVLENSFSSVLGEGSRWLEHIVISLLFLAVLLVETVGLSLTFLTSRTLSQGLFTLRAVANSIGAGDFKRRVQIRPSADSKDEIEALSLSLNNMGRMLEQSYTELENRVSERTSELQELLQMRDRFVATLTHDLRNPLTAARACAQFVLMDNSAVHKFIPKVLSNIDRTESMIQDLLDANLIQAGAKLPFQVAECDFRVIVTESMEDLSAIYGKRFVLQANPIVPGYWGAKELRRIIDNLLVNAVKYGDQDSPIQVVLRVTDEKVQLRVHNEGKGLSDEEQASIFVPFSRTRSAAQGLKKGWGLGLTLVRGIAKAHGGSIFVESRAGKGATFIVELPIDSRPFQT